MKIRYPTFYKTQYVALKDDTTLPVTVVGNGQPVLLIHAFGMDAREFLLFILPLCTQYQFYLPHMRGFGLSADIEVGQFDFIERYASDIADVIDDINQAHDSTQIHVAGISMGALVMWAYFSNYGDSKVSRYLNIDQIPAIHSQENWGGLYVDAQKDRFAEFQKVLDAALPFMNKDTPDFSHLPFAVKQSISTMAYEFSLSSVSRPFTEQIVKLLRYQPAYKMALLEDKTWQHQLRCLHAYMTLPYDYRAVLSEVTIPVTMLIGARSKLYDMDEQLSVASQLPNGRAIVLPKSGHAVPVDAPIGFYKVLKGFLGED